MCFRTMNLSQHYTELYNKSIAEIADGRWQGDDLIDSPDDMRRGTTLIIRPDNKTKSEIRKFLNKLAAIDPAQYYYPNTDIHITVMSIISCYEGFSLSKINTASYIDVIQKSISDYKNFEITFRGITMSSSCIMIQGFPGDNTLNQIRNSLRNNFKNSDLEQSIDKRYTIQTAHSTVVRFKRNPDELLNLANDYKNFHFGKFKVDTLEFVYNDWYQRKESVKELYKFVLK